MPSNPKVEMTKEDSKDQAKDFMTDSEMVEVHTRLNREKHPPTQGFLVAPLIFVFVFGCLIFVCSIQLAHSTNQFQLHPPQEIVELTDEEKEALRLERKFDSGKKIFAVRCASCHQTSGLGIAGQYPPLVDSKWATSDPGLIANIILKGLKGEILVNGETYGTNAAVNMAAVPITDREIANVTTYVRQAWGNNAPEILESEVSTFRNESKDQIDQWTGDQLIEMYPAAFSE
jgi:mono/diheme cytochrome c family protein